MAIFQNANGYLNIERDGAVVTITLGHESGVDKFCGELGAADLSQRVHDALTRYAARIGLTFYGHIGAGLLLLSLDPFEEAIELDDDDVWSLLNPPEIRSASVRWMELLPLCEAKR